MLTRIRPRLTYANVMATLAVFLAFAGGVAWALERNSVKSRHIDNGQVKDQDLNGPTYWAVVDATPSVVRSGQGNTSAGNNGVGATTVDFDRNITDCAFEATIGQPGFEGIGDRGFINVTGAAGTTDSVFVVTESSAPAPADLPFHLAVHC